MAWCLPGINAACMLYSLIRYLTWWRVSGQRCLHEMHSERRPALSLQGRSAHIVTSYSRVNSSDRGDLVASVLGSPTCARHIKTARQVSEVLEKVFRWKPIAAEPALTSSSLSAF